MRPVRCVQTGKLYPFLTTALRQCGIQIGGTTLRRAKEGLPVKGLLFDPVEPSSPDWRQVPKHQTKRSRSNSKAVRCVETGQVYRSMAEAARAVYVDRNCIYYAVYKRGTAAGYHWVFEES